MQYDVVYCQLLIILVNVLGTHNVSCERKEDIMIQPDTATTTVLETLMAVELDRRDGSMARVRREGPSCLTEKDVIPFVGPGRLVH